MDPVRARAARADQQAAEEAPSGAMEKPETSAAPARAEAGSEESLRLLCDLADALDAQARRADRLSAQGDASAAELLQAIGADAARLKRRTDQLRRTLGSGPSPEGSRPQEETSRRRPPPRPQHSGDTSDAARTVAVDLKMAGHGREEVTERLAEVVGEQRAATIVDEVFAPAD
jgi:hypothetical protein